MPTVNEALQDAGISHQIGLQRLSTQTAAKIVALLDRADADLVTQLQRGLPPLGSAERSRLETLLKDIRVLNRDVYRELHKGLKGDLIDIAAYETWFQQRMLASGLTLNPEMFAAPTRQTLIAAVNARPFQGRLLKEWVTGLDAGRFARLRDAIRIGVVEGESIDQIVKRIRGTRALRFKDGILEVSRRSAEAMVRTAVNHTATRARHLTYAENADVVEKWQFVAVLDSRTTEICMGLDGQVFPVGEGPEPPRHINCRSTTVPLLKGEKPAPRVTYNAWLKRQPVEVQNEILGPTKARLFRNGGLTIDRFANDNRAYTIEELKRRESAAFERAGLQ